jgi:hypothetical protein
MGVRGKTMYGTKSTFQQLWGRGEIKMHGQRVVVVGVEGGWRRSFKLSLDLERSGCGILFSTEQTGMGAETGNAGGKRNGRLLCKNLQDGNNRRRGANMAQQTGRECEVSLSIHHGTYVGVPQV